MAWWNHAPELCAQGAEAERGRRAHCAVTRGTTAKENREGTYASRWGMQYYIRGREEWNT